MKKFFGRNSVAVSWIQHGLSFLLSLIIFVCTLSSVTVAVYADNAANLAAHQVTDEIIQNYVEPDFHLDKYALTETEEAELLLVAQEATSGLTTDYEIISAITQFVAEEIYYDYDYYDGRTTTLFYKPYEVWTNKRTVCEGYARLTKELLNLLNIPCMCIRADNHVYNGAYDADNDRWIYLDATWCSGNMYENGVFEKGSYYASRFDMSIEKLSTLSSHQVYGITGIVVDEIEYELETPKTAADWPAMESWLISVNGVSDDFATTEVELINSLAGVNVTTINDSAFFGCSTITTVTIPEGITDIGYRAFGNCTGLTSVSIADSVTTIANTVFKGCTSLTAIVIPDSVTSLGNSVFQSCTSLTSVTLPEGTTSIGQQLFRECTSLERITLPEGITKIGDYAFYGCTNLASISLPECVTVIGSHAFRECAKLTSFVIPDGVTSISSYLFYKCSALTSVTIPDGITSIGDCAFYGCKGLTSIPIPENVTQIGNAAFRECENVKSFTIPEGVTSLGSYTFRDCKSITAFTLPDGITNIGFGSFYNCTNLTSISIPDSVTTIDSYAFCQCYELESVDIPKNVTSIGMCAFHACADLSSVVIPDGVTSIADKAFQSCVGLTSVSIPDSVLTIGEYAFRHCALKSVVIPKNVTSMGDYVFQGCGGLKKVVMYDNLTSIGVDAVTSPTVIYCYENSAAHNYAVENGLDYVLIQLYSADSDINVDFNNRIIFSSKDGCTDVADMVSAAQDCMLVANANLLTGNTTLYGTGSEVVITIDGVHIDEYIVVVEGDTNGDGVCDALDASQTALALNGYREFENLQMYAANGCISDLVDVSSYQNVVNHVIEY